MFIAASERHLVQMCSGRIERSEYALALEIHIELTKCHFLLNNLIYLKDCAGKLCHGIMITSHWCMPFYIAFTSSVAEVHCIASRRYSGNVRAIIKVIGQHFE